MLLTSATALGRRRLRAAGGGLRPRLPLRAPRRAFGIGLREPERAEATALAEPAARGSRRRSGHAPEPRHYRRPAALGPTAYDRSSSLEAVAYAVLRRELAKYIAREEGARLGEDVEALHKMRVASRRMRTALRVFDSVLPSELTAQGSELRWVAGVLGEVRDLDVQVASLRERARGLEQADALAPLEQRLEELRDEARGRMLLALDSPRHEAMVGVLATTLRTGPASSNGVRPAVMAAPTLLRETRDRLDRLARELDGDSEDEQFHKARIRAKQLRYATEFVQELYGRPAERLLGALKEVQDELGRGQDAAVAIERLRDLAAADPALPRETLFVMGRLAEQEARTLEERGEAFDAIYTRFRKRWKRLEQAFRR